MEYTIKNILNGNKVKRDEVVRLCEGLERAGYPDAGQIAAIRQFPSSVGRNAVAEPLQSVLAWLKTRNHRTQPQHP